MEGSELVIIKVASKNTARTLINKPVSIGISDFWIEGVTNRIYTDSYGEARFDIDPCDGTVYVDGKNVYYGRIAGRILVYV